MLIADDSYDYPHYRSLQEKYELNLPAYPGFDQIVELPSTDESEMSQRL